MRLSTHRPGEPLTVTLQWVLPVESDNELAT
jgi:hypothetical protein